jgi:hypothetical protein
VSYTYDVRVLIPLALAAILLIAACGRSLPTSPTASPGDPNATATLTPVAASADWPASSPAAERWTAPIEFLYSHILPAVQ